MSPPGGGLDAQARLVTPEMVETEATQKARRRRKRRIDGRSASDINRHTVREINKAAETRLAARLDADPHPNVEYSTTARLEDLFDERRDETAGTLHVPYSGSIMGRGWTKYGRAAK